MLRYFIRLATATGLAILASHGSQANTSDLRSMTIPSEACEIIATQFSGDAWGGRDNASIYVCAQPGATGTVSVKCPVPLSNVRVSGSGSPQLSKFRVYYADRDAGGTGSQVYVALNKKYIAGASVPIDLVCNPWDSDVNGRAVETATSATSVCPTPYVFQARTFYNLAVRLTAGLSDVPRCTQFYGIDFP